MGKILLLATLVLVGLCLLTGCATSSPYTGRYDTTPDEDVYKPIERHPDLHHRISRPTKH